MWTHDAIIINTQNCKGSLHSAVAISHLRILALTDSRIYGCSLTLPFSASVLSIVLMLMLVLMLG